MAAAPLRMTKARSAILKEVGSGRRHPTVDEVFRAVRRRLPRVGLGTVYRNLAVLEEHGLVRGLGEVAGRRRYEVAGKEHCHVVCERCGALEDVCGSAPATLTAWLRKACDFEVHGYRLSFSGLCPRCAGTGRHTMMRGRRSR